MTPREKAEWHRKHAIQLTYRLKAARHKRHGRSWREKKPKTAAERKAERLRMLTSP